MTGLVSKADAAAIAGQEAERCERQATKNPKNFHAWIHAKQTARAIERAILEMEDGMTVEQTGLEVAGMLLTQVSTEPLDPEFAKVWDENFEELLEASNAPDAPEVRFSEEAISKVRAWIGPGYSSFVGISESVLPILAADATTQLRAAEKAAYERGFEHGKNPASGFDVAALAEIILNGFMSRGSYGPNPMKDMARHAAEIVLSRMKVPCTLADEIAPPSEPDLEKMQKALVCAFEKSPYLIAVEFMQRGGKHLAAEGFRLGDADATPVTDKAHPRFTAGYMAGLNDNDLENAAHIQARIDAAVREEREAQGDAVMRLAHVKQFCEAWLHPDRLEDGTINASAQKSFQGVWRVAGFEAIRARTTNSETAGAPVTPAKEGAFADAPAAGESQAPTRKLKIPVHEFLETGDLYMAEQNVHYKGYGKPFFVEIPIPQSGDTP